MKINRFKLFEERDEDGEERPSPIPPKNEKTPALDHFGVDITKLAKEGKLEPVVGRKNEVMQLSWVLCRKKKNNPVLIGEPGTGKTAIIEGLAQLIVAKKCPEVLLNKRIVSLEMGNIVAGAKAKGEFEERVKAIIGELEKNSNIIIFIDEIHMIVGSGGGEIDAANMFKPALARGVVQCIGATTLNEFRNSIEKDGALERRFQKVLVEETTPDETLEILKNIKSRYEDYHKVIYSDDSLKACVDLANKHIQDRFFPDKAIDLLDEVGAKAHLNDESPKEITDLEEKIEDVRKRKDAEIKNQNYELSTKLRVEEKKLMDELNKLREKHNLDNKIKITAEDVAEVFSIKTGIPAEKFSEEEGAKLLNLSNNLKMDVIGQDEAIIKLSKCVKRNRAGLKDPKKPIGVFLFLGTTGTGKTQTAKSLAKHLFGSEDAMFRIDMSEYREKHNASRLIGSPPGYVGYGEGGQLTEKIRRKPYCVLLLDEIEKAAPEVLTYFLQVFDDGILTDGQGRKISFKNTIIIMTSNIGTNKVREIRPDLGFVKKTEQQREENIKDVMRRELNDALPPEFINRIDEIVIFSSLGKENIYKIIDIEIGKLSGKLKGLGYTLTITDKVKDFLMGKGYDERMGARPLKRAITSYLEEPIADEILRKEVKDVIAVDYDIENDVILINNVPVVEKMIRKFGDFIKRS